MVMTLFSASETTELFSNRLMSIAIILGCFHILYIISYMIHDTLYLRYIQDFNIYHLGEWLHPVKLADVVGILVGTILLGDEHSGLKEGERYIDEHSGLTKGREVHLN